MRLPPLHAIRFFEAAARLRSFKAAASELNVTPGAVTKQVQALETFLGVRLFERNHRSVALTPDGAAYLKAASAAFETLSRATAALLREDGEGPLNIWCTTLFMQQWLVQRLASFRALHPDLEVTITVGDLGDAMPPDADVGIRIGEGSEPGLASHHLIDIRLIPVCSPSYRAKVGPLDSPQDLAGHTLLRSNVRPNAWRTWLSFAGIEDPPHVSWITFPNSSAAYRASMEGVGIALGHRRFIEHDVAAGRLLTPFAVEAPTPESYRLVYPKSRRAKRRIVQFRRWILAALAAQT